ncbi:MsnO8 family LLM class oxidoreductase [Priestia filamentosa]|uniref:MsnO8 family LLM class oxidoreductase n=1 Tax=Priestia filamentosa TaxID=1402861 RepID=UPI0002F95A83|nr:MsnO8 family LLM class oxidoreductase [Priestia filamentosa]
MEYKISLLDQSPIYEGETAFHALQKTVELAQEAEKWGYHRFWVSEHHNAEKLAGSSPEVLMAYLLAKTNNIRIGSGGVMLQHYSPYKVAENFSVLSALAPKRVDLGIGKAPGGLPLSTKALQFGTVNDGGDFEERLSLLYELLEKELPQGHPLVEVNVTPEPPENPRYYLLGASAKSAEIAAKFGWNFVFAKFINSDSTAWTEAVEVYRSLSPNGHFAMAISVFAADHQKEAEERVSDQTIYKVALESGRIVTVNSLEQAEGFGLQSGQAYEIRKQKLQTLAGTPQYIHSVLKYYHEHYGVKEFIFHTPIEDRQARKHSFHLLSAVHSLKEKRKENVF